MHITTNGEFSSISEAGVRTTCRPTLAESIMVVQDRPNNRSLLEFWIQVGQLCYREGSKGLTSSSYQDCGGLLFFARRSNRALLIGRALGFVLRALCLEDVVAIFAIPLSLSI